MRAYPRWTNHPDGRSFIVQNEEQEAVFAAEGFLSLEDLPEPEPVAEVVPEPTPEPVAEPVAEV